MLISVPYITDIKLMQFIELLVGIGFAFFLLNVVFFFLSV